MENRLYISMYHYTRDLKNSDYPEIKGLDYDLFDRQLAYFKDNFNVIRMEDLLDCYDGKFELPEKAMLLTFDDGYIDNHEAALPLLKKYGFTGSFFIPAKTFCENKLLDVNKIHFILAVVEQNGNVLDLVKEIYSLLDEYRNRGFKIKSNEDLFEEYGIANRFDSKEIVFCKRILQTALEEKIRNEITDILFEKYVGIKEEDFSKKLYMSREMLLDMKKEGMFIGIHGYDHYWLGNLEEDKMKKDIDRALDQMSEYIDRDRWVMNYPYGSYNERVIDYISSKGCVLGLTTKVNLCHLDLDNRYELPRFDCNDFPPKSEHYKEFE